MSIETAFPALAGSFGSDRAEALLRAQRDALAMVVRGEPLAEVLASLTQVVEDQADGEVVASILMMDGQGVLTTGAAPSLPADYNAAIDGLKASPEIGTCSAAAATRQVVITPDIDGDPKWSALKALPLGLGLVAAWSQPIVSGEGRVLGTFGTYFRERRGPSSLERRLVEAVAHTAALAIERSWLEAEREAAAERQRLLLNELNHRVKNTLATVQSIISHTLRSERDPEVVRRVTDERLQLMARAHDLLTERSWSGALVGEVVDRAIAPFRAPGAAALAAGGPDIAVPPQTALALAMALHELATNAVKYGALSRPEGKVRIDWREADAEGRPGFTLRWSESGGPPVSPPARVGFGTRLLERALAAETGGAARLQFLPEGLCFEATAPAHRQDITPIA